MRGLLTDTGGEGDWWPGTQGTTISLLSSFLHRFPKQSTFRLHLDSGSERGHHSGEAGQPRGHHGSFMAAGRSPNNHLPIRQPAQMEKAQCRESDVEAGNLFSMYADLVEHICLVL